MQIWPLDTCNISVQFTRHDGWYVVVRFKNLHNEVFELCGVFLEVTGPFVD